VQEQKNKMKNQIIVFDLYNTLIEIQNKKHYFIKLYKMSYNGFNLKILDYITLIMTNNLNDLFSLLPIEFKILYHENISILNEELNSIVIFDDVLNILGELQKEARLYIISNLATPYKIPIYNLKLVHYFENIIFSCDYGYIKPSKKIFQLVENNTKCKKQEILMIGDSEKSDIQGARNMEWNYLKINRKGKNLKEYEIKHLSEIKTYINNL
jgi:FMN phosphatase YigB (HAD superfamily)